MLFYSFCPCHEPQGTGHWAIRTEYKLDMTWNRMISGAWIARGNGNGDIAYYLKPDGRLVQNETILQPLKRNEGCRRVRDAICWNLLVFFAKRRWAFFGNIGLYSWQKPSNGRPRFLVLDNLGLDWKRLKKRWLKSDHLLSPFITF